MSRPGPPSPIPAAFDPLLADPGSSAVLLDFDGTLADIVPHAADARPVTGAEQALEALGARLALVAVVSGRPASFLVERLPGVGDRVRLVGLYGLEWREGATIRRSDAALGWVEAVDRVADVARDGVPAGLHVEHKGLSVALHWRTAPETERWARAFAATQARDAGLEVKEGRMVVELCPPLAVDKGTVVARLAGASRAVAFFGDDLGDLAAFAALERLGGRGAHTVAVAVSGPEAPPALLAAADVIVGSPAEAVATLAGLAAAVARSG